MSVNLTKNGASLTKSPVVSRLPGLPQRLSADIAQAMQLDLLEEARKNASKGGTRGLHVRTGRLFRSIRVVKTGSAGGERLNLQSVFYGAILNDGGAQRSGIGAGSRRQGRSVIRSARPWASDAVDTVRERLPAYLKRYLAREVKG